MGDSLSGRLVNKSGNFQTKLMPDSNGFLGGFVFCLHSVSSRRKSTTWNKAQKVPREPVVLLFFFF